MKKLFIYYSDTGNCELIANTIKNEETDVIRIVPLKKLPKVFFFKVLKMGMLAGLNHKMKIEKIDFDIDDYDEVTICSPVWNGKLACPINYLLKEYDFKGKINKFILSSGSGEAKKAQEFINEKYNVNIIFLKEPLTHSDELKKIY